MVTEATDGDYTVEILRLFISDYSLKFGVIQRSLGLRSNKLSYYLKTLVRKNVLLKEGDYYSLTKDYEEHLPFLSNIDRKSLNPLPVVLVALINKGKILLIKRSRRPYKGYWCMIGGKMLSNETIKDSSKRIVLEKAGIKSKFFSINDVAHERVIDSGKVKHSFILFFTKNFCNDNSFISKTGEELGWFSIRKIKEMKRVIVPSDFWFLNNRLDKKYAVKQFDLIDDEGWLRLKR